MSTQEDRIASLERKVAALELRRMYDEGRARENTPTEQGHNLREINENMTILLGVMGEQGLDIREVKQGVGTLKEDIEQRFNGVDQRLNNVEQGIQQILQQLALLTKKPE